jgi:hypothetical protein
MSYKSELEERYRQARARMGMGVKPPVVPKGLLSAMALGGLSGTTGVAPPLVIDPTPPKPPKIIKPLTIDGEERELTSREVTALRVEMENADMPRLKPLRNYDYSTPFAGWKRMVVAVAEHYEVEAMDILGLPRARMIVRARQECFYRLRTELRMSYLNIAEKMNRDHSTVIHGVNTILGRLLDEQKKREHSVAALPAAMTVEARAHHPELAA